MTKNTLPANIYNEVFTQINDFMASDQQNHNDGTHFHCSWLTRAQSSANMQSFPFTNGEANILLDTDNNNVMTPFPCLSVCCDDAQSIENIEISIFNVNDTAFTNPLPILQNCTPSAFSCMVDDNMKANHFTFENMQVSDDPYDASVKVSNGLPWIPKKSYKFRITYIVQNLTTNNLFEWHCYCFPFRFQSDEQLLSLVYPQMQDPRPSQIYAGEQSIVVLDGAYNLEYPFICGAKHNNTFSVFEIIAAAPELLCCYTIPLQPGTVDMFVGYFYQSQFNQTANKPLVVRELPQMAAPVKTDETNDIAWDFLENFSLEQCLQVTKKQHDAFYRNVWHYIAAFNATNAAQDIFDDCHNKNDNNNANDFANQINQSDRYGNVPLYYAIFGHHDAIFNQMLDSYKSISVTHVNHSGISLLHLCAFRGYIEMATCLWSKMNEQEKITLVNCHTKQGHDVFYFLNFVPKESTRLLFCNLFDTIKQ